MDRIGDTKRLVQQIVDRLFDPPPLPGHLGDITIDEGERECRFDPQAVARFDRQ
jgi:hypothetical protein